MNRNDLHEILRRENIPEDAYSLFGGLPNEKFCINKIECWEVYYSEKGIKTQLKKFDTEDKACEYLYNKLRMIL